MKILIEGDMRKAKSPKRFTCKVCGCVFEANQDEYEYDIGWRNDGYYTVDCPTCARKVVMYEEEC